MGGVAKKLDPTGNNFLGLGNTVGRAVGDVATGGLAEFGQQHPFGLPIINPLSKLGQGGNPSQQNPVQAGQVQGNPTMLLAQSGGTPLLAQVLAGSSVDDAVAGYFGQSSSSFQQFYNSLSDSDKAAVDGIKNQLNDINNNTNLKNQAAQQLVNDFPNIAQQAAQTQYNASQQAGQNAYDTNASAISTNQSALGQALQAQSQGLSMGLDQNKQAFAGALQTQRQGLTQALGDYQSQITGVNQQLLGQASDQLAAKYAAQGGFSSGAFNASLARAATDITAPEAQGLANLASQGDLNLANFSARGQLGLGNQAANMYQLLGNQQAQNYTDIGQQQAANIYGLGQNQFSNLANLGTTEAANQLQAFQNQYDEANALRQFQQTMLGQGVNQGFSANQNFLNRQQQTNLANAGYANTANQYNQQQNAGLLGSIGGVGGSILGGTLGGPAGAYFGGTLGGGLLSGGGTGAGIGQGIGKQVMKLYPASQ